MKSRKSWTWMARILRWNGASPQVLGVFFKAVVQAVIQFGSETWVMTPCMGRVLGIFLHRVGRQIIRRQPKRREDGFWDYPPLETEMEEAGF